MIGVPKEQKFPFIVAELDTGPFVLALMKESPGKNLIAYWAWISIKELIDTFTQTKGVKTRCTVVQMDMNSPNEFAAGYAENTGYISECGFKGRDDETITHPRDVSRISVRASSSTIADVSDS